MTFFEVSLSYIRWRVQDCSVKKNNRFNRCPTLSIKCCVVNSGVGEVHCALQQLEITPLNVTSDIWWARRDIMFVRDCHEILMNLCLHCNCLPKKTEETVRAAGLGVSLGDGDETKLVK